MAFNANALTEQVKLEDGFKLATKAVTESKLAKSLIGSGNFQAGVITKAPILKLSTDVVFQKQGCGRVAIGDTVFTEKYVEVASLAVYKDICYKNLEGTYMAQALAKGDDPEQAILDGTITKQILDKEIALVNEAVEKALFLGDITLTGATNANLNKFDGIKKQVSAVSATTVAGATVIEKLQALYMAMPETDRLKEDAYIFISDSIFEEYKLALWNKNMFREDGNTTLAGTSIKLFPTSGLNGTREVYALRLENLQLAFNGSPETTDFDLWYSKDDNIFKQNTYFSVGISVIFPEDVRKATV
ncbi:hypothetical protein [Pedobacter gandavensis]|uniref:hypothetical protein n=1 Tax=Pedobacter gandavensis TaxID=2679963 RepID=UPI00292EFDA8|nr:hypothetical protein [Pedobacter gandavensis]